MKIFSPIVLLERRASDCDVVVAVSVGSDPVKRGGLDGQGRGEAALQLDVVALLNVDCRLGVVIVAGCGDEVQNACKKFKEMLNKSCGQEWLGKISLFIDKSCWSWARSQN